MIKLLVQYRFHQINLSKNVKYKNTMAYVVNQYFANNYLYQTESSFLQLIQIEPRRTIKVNL